MTTKEEFLQQFAQQDETKVPAATGNDPAATHQLPAAVEQGNKGRVPTTSAVNKLATSQ